MIPGLLGALSGGFRPTGIGGCVLWLDASQIAGLSNNDAVATWTDLSGQGNHATQSTGIKQPAYKTGIIAGHPVVRFDGVNDVLQTENTVLASGAYTVFIAFASWDAHSGRVLNGRTNNWLLGSYSTYSDRCYNQAWVCEGTDTSAAAQIAVHSTDATTGGTYWKNGIERGASALATAAPGGVTIGGGDLQGGSGEEFEKGDVCEIIAYSSALTTINRQTIERYLAQKWGITIDQAPVNTVAPALSGTFAVGQSVSCDDGTWTNTPTTFTYQWYKLISPGSYNQIVGATNSSFLITADLETFKIQCRVSASNAFAGPTEAQSADSDVITA